MQHPGRARLPGFAPTQPVAPNLVVVFAQVRHDSVDPRLRLGELLRRRDQGHDAVAAIGHVDNRRVPPDRDRLAGRPADPGGQAHRVAEVVKGVGR